VEYFTVGESGCVIGGCAKFSTGVNIGINMTITPNIGYKSGTINMWFRDNEPYLEFLDSKTKDSAKDAAYAAIRNAFKFEIEDDF